MDLWYDQTAASASSSDPVGVIDLKTSDASNSNISIRPGGTGKIYATKSLILPTAAPGLGGSANSGTYLTSAIALNTNKQIQKLSGFDYYLPPGTEGQIMHFVPTTGATHTIKVWFQIWRVMTGVTASTSTNSAWVPFSNSVSGNGPAYAIYTDNAWTTSHGFTS